MEKLSFANHALENECFYMAELLLEPGERILPHRHDFYEFFIVLRGTFSEICNGQKRTLRRRSLHIIRPDDEHELSVEAPESASLLRNIAIEQQTFERYALQFDVSAEKLGGHYLIDESTFCCYVEKTELLYAGPLKGKKFNFLMQNILQDIMISAVFKHSDSDDIPKWLQSAYRGMEREENYSVGLPRLLDLTGKSQEHLTRLFRKHYNVTPSEYVNMIRMQNASRLLQTSDDKIIDIALSCGYNSVTYFNRLFKARYGVSPTEYRENKKSFFESI